MAALAFAKGVRNGFTPLSSHLSQKKRITRFTTGQKREGVDGRGNGESDRKNSMKILVSWRGKSSRWELQRKRASEQLLSANGDLGVVQQALLSGARINCREKKGEGNSALTTAAAEGQLDIVRYLLETGASIHKPNRQGDSALIAASSRGQANIVRHLLAVDGAGGHKSTQRNLITGDTALIKAIRHGHLVVAKLLISGGNVNAQPTRNDTEAVRLLLDLGKATPAISPSLSLGESLEVMYKGAQPTPLLSSSSSAAMRSLVVQQSLTRSLVEAMIEKLHAILDRDVTEFSNEKKHEVVQATLGYIPS
eukprot:jgi/Bigna1/90707/estExt_fgenesh1_pg.C_770036